MSITPVAISTIPTHLIKAQEGAQSPAVLQSSLTQQQHSSYSVSIGDNQTRSLTYQTSSQSSVSQTTAVSEPPERLDGAKNILQFIEQRLASEKSNGASDEQLDELLQQGLSGFEQGYGEAVAILQGTSALSESVNESISTLYEQVVGGLNALRESYFEDSDAFEPIDSKAPAVELAAPIETINTDFISQLHSKPLNEAPNIIGFAQGDDHTISALIESLDATQTQLEYTRKESFSFELTTADGDTLSINAKQNTEAYGEYYASNNSASVNESYQHNSHFSFNLEGELDEGEVVAIEQLLDQVFTLASDFYNGDVGKAYEAALTLGYDQSEITGYALDLKQSDTYKVAATYQQFVPTTPAIAPEAHQALSYIGDFAQQVLTSLHDANNYERFDYRQLLDSIAQQIDAQSEQKSTGFASVIDELTTRI